MQIMNIQNTFNRSHRLANLTKLKIPRSPFQQNIQRLPHDPD